jgi:voltage-gated potassium channel
MIWSVTSLPASPSGSTGMRCRRERSLRPGFARVRPGPSLASWVMVTNDEQIPVQRYGDLPKRERRLVLLKAAGRLIVSLAVLIGVYILIPPESLVDGTAGVEIILSAALLVGLIAWEIYRIVTDPHPEVRAGVSLIVVLTAVIVMFALTYATISAARPEAFSVVLDKGSAVYFTVTTLATVGFGDITATDTPARWVVTAQMLLGLVLLVGLARVMVLAAKVGRAKQGRSTGK